MSQISKNSFRLLFSFALSVAALKSVEDIAVSIMAIKINFGNFSQFMQTKFCELN